MSLSTSPLSSQPQQVAHVSRQSGPKSTQQEVKLASKPSAASLEPQDALTPTSQTGTAATSLDLTSAGNEDRNLLARIDNFNQELKQRRPDLIERKFAAMAESPFAFFRATDFLFFQDLKQNPAIAAGPRVNLHGDCHLENLGTYRTAEGEYAYDLNDFDEAQSGPVGFDLARMGTSIQLAAEASGLPSEQQQKLVSHFLQKYSQALDQIAQNPDSLKQALTKLEGKAGKQLDKAKLFDRKAYLSEMAAEGKFKLGGKLLALKPEDRQETERALAAYAEHRPEGPAFYKLKDAAERIAGKGSLGLYRNVVLVEGPSDSPDDDLILELKETRKTAGTEAGLPDADNNARRVVEAFRQNLPGADPYLGVTRLHGKDAYVRELLPKETVNLEKMTSAAEYDDLLATVAQVLARTHARGGSVAELQSYLRSQQAEIQKAAADYHQQVKADQLAFKASRPAAP